MGHFVSSPREREIEEIVEEMKERDRGERKMNESEETEEIKTFPIYPYLLQGQQALPNCKAISALVAQDTRHLCLIRTTPAFIKKQTKSTLAELRNRLTSMCCNRLNTVICRILHCVITPDK